MYSLIHGIQFRAKSAWYIHRDGDWDISSMELWAQLETAGLLYTAHA